MLASPSTQLRRGDVLALGFGITVAMWAVGYVGRLPFVLAPSPLILAVLLACPMAVGWAAGRWHPDGVRAAATGGVVCGVLNLLVLGSFLSGESPNAVHPSALIFVPGFVLAVALLAAMGALAGRTGRDRSRTEPDWTASFSKIAAAATFLLVIVGGLVTSNKAGLAVVDWPNSSGYNMFLYPFSRMTGGIYYEHAHRLFGSLVGLTTIALAVHLRRVEDRDWLKRLALAAVGLVVFQGILGGLRVTGRFTLSDDPLLTQPNIYLAVAHGVLGQVFFATMVALAVFTSREWKESGAARTWTRAAADRMLAAALVSCLLVQLAFGAIQRHLALGLVFHIALACVVATLGIAAGFRAWAFYADEPLVRRAGLVVAVAVVAQFGLGLGAYLATRVFTAEMVPFVVSMAITTLHQATGALLLAASVTLLLWERRRLGTEDYLPATSVPNPRSS